MDLVTLCCLEWTLNEQVAIAAMDCQCLGVAQVRYICFPLIHTVWSNVYSVLSYIKIKT